jgi:hypothetical protein
MPIVYRLKIRIRFSQALKGPGNPLATPPQLPSQLIVPFIYTALHTDLRQPLARANVLQ